MRSRRHPLRVAAAYRPACYLLQGLRRTFIVNSGFSRMITRDEAVTAVDENIADLVAVGRPAIANPDLVTAGRRAPTRTR